MRHAKEITNIFLVIFLFVLCCQSCTPGQDATNFNKFINQDTRVKGKAGILITALGQPENYDYTFFDNYLNLIFNAAFPWYLKFIIMRDSGTVLRDPENLFAQVEFVPKTLMDCFGKIINSKGVPYTKLKVKWAKPRKGSDGGHFLWEQKNGYIDIAEKTAIKVAASYYNRMPGKKIPYMQQHEAIFDNLKKLMAKNYPETPIRTASAFHSNLQREVETTLQGTGADLVFADTEFSGEDDDPDNNCRHSSWPEIPSIHCTGNL